MALKIGLLGKKIGMTQVFADDGESIPVTVIQTGPCHVVGTRTQERDGYTALAGGTDALQPGDALLDVLIEYIAAHSPVAPVVEGRTADTRPEPSSHSSNEIAPVLRSASRVRYEPSPMSASATAAGCSTRISNASVKTVAADDVTTSR